MGATCVRGRGWQWAEPSDRRRRAAHHCVLRGAANLVAGWVAPVGVSRPSLSPRVAEFLQWFHGYPSRPSAHGAMFALRFFSGAKSALAGPCPEVKPNKAGGVGRAESGVALMLHGRSCLLASDAFAGRELCRSARGIWRVSAGSGSASDSDGPAGRRPVFPPRSRQTRDRPMALTRLSW